MDKINAIPSGHDGNGYVTINGRVLPAFKMQKIRPDVEMIIDSKRFLGDRVEQNAPRGMRIGGDLSYYHTTSAFIEAIKEYKNGGDYPDINIQYYTETAERGRSEILLSGVVLKNVPLGELDDGNDNAVVIDTTFSADDFDVIAKFKE